jgi:hypothetical protein
MYELLILMYIKMHFYHNVKNVKLFSGIYFFIQKEICNFERSN